MAEFDYDLFVIGAGSGGVRAARIAAGFGAKVAVAEEHRVGGTCVIRGCVPKKLMVYASQFSEAFEDAAGYGWTVPEATFDWAKLIAAKDAEIDRLNAIYIRNLTASGAELFQSRAVVEGPHEVRICEEDRTVTARIILVATGGSPWLDMTLAGIDNVITSNEVFYLKEMPKRVVIAGGGYIAVEFAGIFNGLGADTTLVYRGPEILRGFDDEIRACVRAEMEKRGVKFEFDTIFSKLEKGADGITATLSNGKTLAADQVLFATGRRPATEGLGLETAGVELDGVGAVKVNHESRSSVPSIYAIGDVTNRVNLTPVAIREGHAFADTVFGGTPRHVDHTLIPTAVFSQPEIGTVGLTEQEAVEAFDAVDVYRASFRPMIATLSGRDERMLMKVLVDAQTDKVLGVHVVGHGAGEMAQVLGIAVKMGATKADFDATVAVHPTAAEELVTMRTPSAQLRREAA
ncbi:glutathione-disulfide reductase [Acuticoccus sp. I52.16.1]|uniref:glutathione-disulfide reductase n=1 Tax=Acuticoccus sp. I52.16.1 TaxID=2928472 RepID=UPI001FD006BC|nr:glutathione-disulfide reductase [Acuticoccus sp. I52.16.1]UOM33648.1 glutathione-disulfide reductase [Acuticoccus sp. I52.16.1]